MTIHTNKEALRLFWTGKTEDFIDYIWEAPKENLREILIACQGAWTGLKDKIPDVIRATIEEKAVTIWGLGFIHRSWRKR